jgi:hypothetical protein
MINISYECYHSVNVIKNVWPLSNQDQEDKLFLSQSTFQIIFLSNIFKFK